jgi:histidinol-phosphate aminotransferase
MIKSKKLISMIERPIPDTLERRTLYRFEKNERTTLFSKEEFDQMLSTLTPFDLVAYGELEPFYKTVCEWLKVDRSELLITAGSDLGIKAVYETFIAEGDEVINYAPNYAMFSVYAKMFGAIEVVKYYNDNLLIDIDDLISSISPKTRMVVISNPGHNGVTIPEDDILRVLEHTKNTNTIVLVDEAYVDFSEVDMLKHIGKYNNLLIVRTMSKAFGIASVRIGFLLACKELIDELYRVKPVHEIDGIAAKIGKYLIENQSIKEKFVDDVNEGKKVLKEKLTEMGMEVLPSDTNFMYFKLNSEADPKQVVEALMKKNIFIKTPISAKPFSTYLRTTVGDAAQMEHFCAELSETLKSVN